jgi:hypothetical protein
MDTKTTVPPSPGLIIRDPLPHAWEMGSKKATKKLGADAGELNPSGDWLSYVNENELQRRFLLETSNCTNYGTLKALIALATFKGYLYFPRNCSERYTGVCTGTSLDGNDPWHVIETIATKCGVIHEELLPWTNEDRWESYYSPKPMTTEFILEGQRILRKYDIEPEWVFHSRSSLSPEEKRAKIKEALKRGPVCVSVQAWSEKDGVYYKRGRDNHWVWLAKYDGENPVIHDQYEPFVKTLHPDYDFDVAIVYFMRHNPTGILPKDRPRALALMKKAVALIRELIEQLKTGVWAGSRG